MATKKYVDLTGLTEFKSKLLNAYKNNNLEKYADFEVAKATAASTAEKATKDASGNVITSTYTPMTRTIAGVDLADNITKAEMLTALNVEDGAQVNDIENFGWKPSGWKTGDAITWITPATVQEEGKDDKLKAVVLDLSGYALKSEISGVLLFQGACSGDELAQKTKTRGHVWFVNATGTTESTKQYKKDFEYACDGSNWVELGGPIDLSSYATKSYVDTEIGKEATARDGAIATAIAALDAEKTSTDGTKVAVKVTEADGVITAVNVTETDIASAALLGTTADTKTDATAFGYIAKEADDRATAITNAINALAAEKSQTAGTDGLALSIKEVNGKITEISGSIAANTYDAYGAASDAETAAKGYADGLIAALDATVRGNLNNDDTIETGKKVGVKVVEADGKLTSVTVVENDIASAALLGTTSDAATASTAFGYIKKEASDRDTAIATAIAGLNAEKSQTAGTDGLALSITEVDGKITAISGSIAANTYDAHGAASTAESNAKGYTDSEIGKLDYTSTGAAGSYVQKVAETDGVIAETIVAFDKSIGSTSTDNNAPTSKAAYDCAKAFYDDIDAVTTAEIDALFPAES